MSSEGLRGPRGRGGGWAPPHGLGSSGLPTVVKLGDREALLREREEKRRVSGWGGRTVTGAGGSGRATLRGLPCGAQRLRVSEGGLAGHGLGGRAVTEQGLSAKGGPGFTKQAPEVRGQLSGTV